MKDIENYSKLGLDKIKNVEILNETDVNTITELSTELQRVFQVKQIWRTETEMKYSVLNDIHFPTPAAKYFQCVREQDAFFSELMKLSCDYQIKQGELEIAEIEFNEIDKTSMKGKAKAKIKDGEIKLMKFSLIQMRLAAHDRVREIKLWEKLKNELCENNDFDINDVSKHQIESYKARWEKELNIATQTNNATVYKNSFSNLNTLLEDQKNG